jgi:hypothetical protein
MEIRRSNLMPEVSMEDALKSLQLAQMLGGLQQVQQRDSQQHQRRLTRKFRGKRDQKLRKLSDYRLLRTTGIDPGVIQA